MGQGRAGRTNHEEHSKCLWAEEDYVLSEPIVWLWLV